MAKAKEMKDAKKCAWVQVAECPRCGAPIYAWQLPGIWRQESVPRIMRTCASNCKYAPAIAWTVPASTGFGGGTVA